MTSSARSAVTRKNHCPELKELCLVTYAARAEGRGGNFLSVRNSLPEHCQESGVMRQSGPTGGIEGHCNKEIQRECNIARSLCCVFTGNGELPYQHSSRPACDNDQDVEDNDNDGQSDADPVHKVQSLARRDWGLLLAEISGIPCMRWGRTGDA